MNRLCTLALALAASALVAAAQTPTPSPTPDTVVRGDDNASITTSTTVSAGDEGARGLDLRVGVAVGAERIDVTLRNVRGSVRFRGSLDALRRVLDARRTAETVAPPPPSSPPPRDVP